ncbi:MAG TPA: hypothetical protein VGH53_05805 [Streptosporangiaceae bacterium]
MSARLPPGRGLQGRVLPPAARDADRVALTLRMVAGLTMPEITHAFLVRETTTEKRITGAKAKIKAIALSSRRSEPLLVSGSGRSGRRCTARVRLDGEPEAEIDEAPASARSQRRPRVSDGGRAGGQSAGRQSAASPSPGWRSRGPRPVPAAGCHSLDFGHALTS